MSNPGQRWSLKDEIKKRKTQEVLRAIEARRYPQPARAGHSAAAPSFAARPAAPQAQRQRAPQTALPTPPTVQALLSLWQRADRGKRQRLIAAIGAALMALVFLGVGLVISHQGVVPASTFAPVPLVSAADTISYLKNAGFPVVDLKALAVSDLIGNINQAVQFSVRRGNDSGVFRVLSYDSQTQANIAAFRAVTSERYRHWTRLQIANVLVFASPTTAPSLRTELASHLTQYLVAPYRPFIPTATPRK